MGERNRSSGCIMIIDDIPENLKLLEEMLGNEGYQVLSIPSGEMGLKVA